MKVSLIIAVYKDIVALDLIFKSLQYQTYKDFGVVVAEDGEDDKMKKFIKNAKEKYDFEIIHTTQEDIGVRKSKSQNNGIIASNGEYLIFIDGDCVLYKNFILNHIKLSCEKCIVTGRRVNLGLSYSSSLREYKISSITLENNFIKEYLKIKEDAKLEKHSEEGFCIKPNGILHKLFLLRNKEISLLGCNMSMYKKSIYEINGFDEALGNSAYASDYDLQWRFKELGYKIISAKFIANQFHLYHKRNETDYNRNELEQIKQNQQNKIYKCKMGVVKILI
jgi:GT2 family glycosyltransferase